MSSIKFKQICFKCMSLVIAISGKINSGKTTLRNRLAELEGWSYVSFGDYVRYVTKERGLPDDRIHLQQIGEELIETNLEDFCRAVLNQDSTWKPGSPLIIDGIRHIEVDKLLRKLVAPSRYSLVYLDTDEQTRKQRLREEGINDPELIEQIESHSTEQEVNTVLRGVADYVIDGSEPLSALIQKLRAIYSDESF